ncbi:phospholipase D-like domain-containing protein DpdK [Streptomyces phytophilus]|uniref:phospholipase D-like domain-containing protein DpdK n=1 Tax=Streptomyces phytophilus TaxID=722715 RepID=UPI0015F051C4|nr:phospholipase D-like domain-containing protein DpdK [Streptomyces phytophilus]
MSGALPTTRTVRTGRRSGLTADALIRTALLAELAAPSLDRVVWVVSAWISDIDLLDNSDGAFDYLLGDDPRERCRLSDLLLLIAAAGTPVHIVTRPEPSNQDFLARLRVGSSYPADVNVVCDPRVHEKTLCGSDWMLSGSMNFTRSGLTASKEQITYTTDIAQVAQAVQELEDEWVSRP